MIIATIYLCLSVLGALCSLYLTARAFHSAVRTGTVEAAARRVYDLAEHPEAFFGVLIAWVLIDAMMILCSFVLLQIWMEHFWR